MNITFQNIKCITSYVDKYGNTGYGNVVTLCDKVVYSNCICKLCAKKRKIYTTIQILEEERIKI